MNTSVNRCKQKLRLCADPCLAALAALSLLGCFSDRCLHHCWEEKPCWHLRLFTISVLSVEIRVPKRTFSEQCQFSPRSIAAQRKKVRRCAAALQQKDEAEAEKLHQV